MPRPKPLTPSQRAIRTPPEARRKGGLSRWANMPEDERRAHMEAMRAARAQAAQRRRDAAE